MILNIGVRAVLPRTHILIVSAESAFVCPSGRSNKNKMVATRSKTKAAAASKPHYEFGGPIGALGIIFGLPAVCYGLVLFCNANGCIRWGQQTGIIRGAPARSDADGLRRDLEKKLKPLQIVVWRDVATNNVEECEQLLGGALSCRHFAVCSRSTSVQTPVNSSQTPSQLLACRSVSLSLSLSLSLAYPSSPEVARQRSNARDDR